MTRIPVLTCLLLFLSTTIDQISRVSCRSLKQSSLPTGMTFTIQTFKGVNERCPSYLSVSNCNGVSLMNSDDGSGAQHFTISTYGNNLAIKNPTCNVFVSAQPCGYDNSLTTTLASTSIDVASSWYFNNVGKNVYNIQNNQVRGGCAQMLSAMTCKTSGSDFFFVPGDTQSGAERWIFTTVSETTASPVVSLIQTSQPTVIIITLSPHPHRCRMQKSWHHQVLRPRHHQQ